MKLASSGTITTPSDVQSHVSPLAAVWVPVPVRAISRLNQVVRIESQEVPRLIALTKTAAQDLIGGHDSIH